MIYKDLNSLLLLPMIASIEGKEGEKIGSQFFIVTTLMCLLIVLRFDFFFDLNSLLLLPYWEQQHSYAYSPV